MKSLHAYVIGGVATAGLVGGAYTAYCIYKRLQAATLPQKWKKVGTLKDIWVYPIKSCGVVSLDRAECTSLGLKDGWLRDRILMITDNKNNFITARAYPELLKIDAAVKGPIVTLSNAKYGTLRVNLEDIIKSRIPAIKAQVWGVPVSVYDCGWQASEWISTYLGNEAGTFRLAYFANDKCRPLRSANKFYKFTKNDTGAFPDETSFNLINEASVADLNSRVKDKKYAPITFRPNFVLKGAQPFEEDNYKYIKIGENIFEIIKPCTRCVMTTIDAETGVRDPESEPLTTLRSYRLMEESEERRAAGNSPRMGVQVALRTRPGGHVSINDTVYFG